MVRADYLEGRCPITCSGTAAATLGCRDGAIDANRQIDQLLKQFSAAKVQDYLRSLARNPEGLAKILPYFPCGARRE
jgi:hypothetical protein